MWLIFSILTVIFWGTSDVIFKSASRNDKNSVVKLLAYNGIVLGVASLGYMVIRMLMGAEFSIYAPVKYLPIAAIYIGSMFFYYKALPLLKISIASPIANSSCMLTTLLCITVLKQKVEVMQWVGIGLILVALIILSLDDSEFGKGVKHARKIYLLGVLFALFYFVMDGVASFLDEYALDESFSEDDVLVSYGVIYMLVGIVCYFIMRRRAKSDGERFRLIDDKKKLLGSFVETGGQFTYIYAFAFGDAAIASPFIASFSVVSIILSRIFLKEKLRFKQYAIISLLVAGMILLSI